VLIDRQVVSWSKVDSAAEGACSRSQARFFCLGLLVNLTKSQHLLDEQLY
jgi:hypothetical protein